MIDRLVEEEDLVVKMIEFLRDSIEIEIGEERCLVRWKELSFDVSRRREAQSDRMAVVLPVWVGSKRLRSASAVVLGRAEGRRKA